ncbi:UvrD-helicase domain-containing protein [Minwuia thermotolerans]|uniref:DNA 3'-5' helicase II n=1 Tax=Minwuia thermotolerans TaxID=2056226 RepID=A0A2M9FW26_9PROT|nr:UvrD-helicase domain-containing protein [Minwuia thermotolerans]PJK27678.1 helicase [Minwuia thermotolerans]
MTDEEVAALLDSDVPFVAVEAPAGCGKTYQGAHYAARTAPRLATGRVLILTHTHAACAAFAQATAAAHRRVEIRTIDSLLVQIAAAYHKSLDLPADPSAWARRQGADGYAALAARVATLVGRHPFIVAAVAERFPVVIADEHQDASADQHAVVMALRNAGTKLRIFGDPMQGIYAKGRAANEALARWEEIKAAAAFAELCTPHRWSDGTPALGAWVLRARDALKNGQPIDLTGALPQGLNILHADNTAVGRGYRLDSAERAPIDRVARAGTQALILTPQNDMTEALAAFWNRAIPIWEGHTRPAVDELITATEESAGDAVAVANAVVAFMGRVAVGFSRSSHGDRLVREVGEGCTSAARGKPARIQQLGRFILEEPNHVGIAKCLAELSRLQREGVSGFETVSIDYRREYQDAIRLGEFVDAHDGLAEINRRRAFTRPTPPARAISTIHKAKGLECDNAMILPCDSRFSSTYYSRCRLYVAISRAKRSLTLVLSRENPSPIFDV